MNRNYKSLENQFIYPSPKGSKLILASPSSLAKSLPVLRSPWGRGQRRTDPARRESSTKSKSMTSYASFPILVYIIKGILNYHQKRYAIRTYRAEFRLVPEIYCSFTFRFCQIDLFRNPVNSYLIFPEEGLSFKHPIFIRNT